MHIAHAQKMMAYYQPLSELGDFPDLDVGCSVDAIFREGSRSYCRCLFLIVFQLFPLLLLLFLGEYITATFGERVIPEANK